MDREQTITALANYFCGPDVAFYSIAMEMPDSTKLNATAKRFFAVREALGIRGWATPDEGWAAIRLALR